MKHALRMLACQAGRGSVPPAIETAYLPFNGTTGYGFAADAVAGVGDTWTLVMKFDGRHQTAPKYFGRVYDGNSNPSLSTVDGVYATGESVTLHGANGSSGTGNYFFADVVGADRTGVQVIALVHRNVPTRRLDYYITRGGVTLATGGADLTAGGVARTPLHYSIAAAVTVIAGVHTLNATTQAPAKWIASAVLNSSMSEAEAQAYSGAQNLESVLTKNRIWAYHVAAEGVGTSVANRGIGTSAPMTLVNANASSLVSL